MDKTAYKIKVNRTTILNKEFQRLQNEIGQGSDYYRDFYVHKEDGMDMSKCNELAQMFRDASTDKVKVNAACRESNHYSDRWIIDIHVKETNN